MSTSYREPSAKKLESEIARAKARGEAMKPFYARDLRYESDSDAFHLTLFSGASVTVPRSLIPGFVHATRDELQEARLAPGGAAIIVSDDLDYSVPGVLRLLSGITEQRRAAGQIKSAKKAAAVRANGKKGGRPRKKPHSA